jgi:hypothetical protein
MSDATSQAGAGGTAPAVGSAVKDVQKGKLPIGTVEDILTAAPKDIKTEILEVPEWGYSVEVRSFTANQAARIKTRGYAFRGENVEIAWAEMEMMQFKLGVKRPDFTEEKVRELHLSSGPGFQRVIKWLDENSGIDKKALEESREEFQGQDERPEV